MAGGSSNDDKTEAPSQKRIDDALAKGDVPRSQEFRHVGTFVSGWIIMAVLAVPACRSLVPVMETFLGQAHQFAVDGPSMQVLAGNIARDVGLAMLLPFAVMLGAGLAGGLMQGRPTFSLGKLAPQWSKLNPVTGWKRQFSTATVVEFAKTLAKFGVVLLLIFNAVWPANRRLESSLRDDSTTIMTLIKGLVAQMFFAVALFVVVLAIADYTYQRFAFYKRLRMTKQEVKDEYKEAEGDPHIKGRIRQMRHARARKRMMAAVPKADVVITNPTHYAVALAYEHGKQAAPRVIAKGTDAVAHRIRDVANKHKIPLVESPPLARALYATVEIDQEIQPEHYKAVAEIISVVLRLRGKLPQRSRPPLGVGQKADDSRTGQR